MLKDLSSFILFKMIIFINFKRLIFGLLCLQKSSPFNCDMNITFSLKKEVKNTFLLAAPIVFFSKLIIILVSQINILHKLHLHVYYENVYNHKSF